MTAEKITYLPEIQRLLPQSVDAERGVLSSFLLAPREIGGLCVEKGITPEHFHLPAHTEIYRVLLALWDGNQPCEFIGVTQHLRDAGKLDQVGGAATISELFTFLPTAANAGYYIEILEEKHTLREIIKVCTEYASRSYDEQDNQAVLLDELEARVLAIRKSDDAEMREVEPRELAMQVVSEIEEFYERRGGISGLATGFSHLDKMLDGLHEQEMIVVAARPSMGKTAFGMNIAAHVAFNLKKTVAVFSLEMSDKQLVQRAMLSDAKVNIHRVKDGCLSDRDFPALTAAAGKVAAGKLRFIDANGASVGAIRAKARRIARRHPDLALIVIDYLQIVRSHSRQAQGSREREISEISAGLKSIAKELKIPVIVLAQLNRGPDQRGGENKGRPKMSDLRESGAIEQDADVVGLLYREEYYAESDDEKSQCEGEATLIIAKQRNGPVGDVPLTFLKEFTRFENRASEHAG